MSISDFIEDSFDLSQYAPLDKIGQGGFGVVYQAVDKRTGKIYAAKISHQEVDYESQMSIRELKREVNILAMVRFASILSFIGYSPTDFEGHPKPVILTEYLPNGSLDKVIQLSDRGLSIDGWDNTKRLINLYGIASGMAFLHSHGIIHRDLKTENIFLDEYLLPKIGDFGLSKTVGDNANSTDVQSTNAIKGTLTYIAPEIFENAEYLPAGDVYAFAFIIYEVMTDEKLTTKLTQYQMIHKVVQDSYRPELKRPLAPAYQELLESCWSQNPEDRPTFSEIANRLEHDPEFRIDGVDCDSYEEYIEYVCAYDQQFKRENQILHARDFLNQMNSHTFKAITINHKLEKVTEGPPPTYAKEKIVELEQKSSPTSNNHSIDKSNEQNPTNKVLIPELNSTLQLQLDLLVSKVQNEKLTSVSIPCEITMLPYSCFKGCCLLEQITIPSSVTSIGKSCFCNCKSLKEITIPSSVTSIGDKCFSSCTSLTEITIPSSVTSIGDGCFSNCTSLTEITIPSSVTSIGDECFYWCESLTEITIPSSVTSIGDECFYWCKSLKEITIPSSVTSIGDECFYWCKSLTEITIPSSVTSIGDKCFYHCESLKEITIPSSVTSIGNECFSNCKSLTEITIPSSVTSIGNECFSWCHSLIEITIPSSVTSIGDKCFSYCESLIKITIPSSVTSIGDKCFYHCKALAEVTIHSNSLVLPRYVFDKCKKLRKLIVPKALNVKNCKLPFLAKVIKI